MTTISIAMNDSWNSNVSPIRISPKTKTNHADHFATLFGSGIHGIATSERFNLSSEPSTEITHREDFQSKIPSTDNFPEPTEQTPK